MRGTSHPRPWCGKLALKSLYNLSQVTELFSEGAASRIYRFPGSQFSTLNTIPIGKEMFACPDTEVANLRIVIASQASRCLPIKGHLTDFSFVVYSPF